MQKIRFFILLCFLLTLNYSTLHAQTDTSTNTVQLKILTWNIQMLPIFIAQKKQPKRAKLIVETLQNTDYDMILFQEAFHKRSVKILIKGLQETYPHIAGPANKKGWPKLTSGLMIFSKLPLQDLQEIRFSECGNADCFSRKGAMMVTAVKESIPFQLLNTHLQADYTKKTYLPIREQQYREVVDGLLMPYQKEGIPQLVCGDFNTIKEDSLNYYKMLDMLTVEDGKLEEEKGKYTFVADDFRTPKHDYKMILDYVLYKKNGLKAKIRREIKRFRKEWKKNRSDLSDHYAIEAVIEWEK